MVELQSVNLFRSLTADGRQSLRAIAQERRFAAGAKVFRESDPADGVYVVRDGSVEISARVGAEARRALSRLEPGEIFGELAIIEGQPHLSTATALKDTTVFFIPRDGMFALIQSSPAFAFDMLQDVSRRLLEFNRLRLREVVEAERLAVIGNFARTIIHDLKTPLTIIGLSAEIAGAPGATPEKRLQVQDQIQKQIRRINDMVGDVLEFSGGGQAEAVPAPAGYSAFVAALLPELRAEAAAKSAGIEVQTEPPAGDIRLDPRRLRRVYFNLLRNATGMMPGGGKIFLRFRADDREMVTEIEDSGRGIASDMLDTLFQPFAPRGKSRGDGLGLAICKKIIEDHRGRIWARSEPGRGAIFCFALPLAK